MSTPYEEVFRQKFTPVEREIERIRDMVHLHKGAWIFKMHTFSRDELLRLPAFDRIYTICEKVGADVIAWSEADAIPPDGLRVYRRWRDRIRRSLQALRDEIRQREPSGLERFFAIFDGVVTTIIQLLPTLARLIRASVKALLTKAPPQNLLPPG